MSVTELMSPTHGVRDPRTRNTPTRRKLNEHADLRGWRARISHRPPAVATQGTAFVHRLALPLAICLLMPKSAPADSGLSIPGQRSHYRCRDLVTHVQLRTRNALDRARAAVKRLCKGNSAARSRSFSKLVDVTDTAALLATYLDRLPRGEIESRHVANKVVGHIGATTSINRTLACSLGCD